MTSVFIRTASLTSEDKLSLRISYKSDGQYQPRLRSVLGSSRSLRDELATLANTSSRMSLPRPCITTLGSRWAMLYRAAAVPRAHARIAPR